ncbi:MAG: hypothetical protein NWF03_02750 [Candidatus Bathyarchaeota archaeon]|nr:hypothetical protein [Candidatus Bathyarchaeota archaeon]
MKRAVVFQRDRIWCKWTDDECNVANCSYATCVRRRLLPNAVCGESVKRRTVDRRPDDEGPMPTVRFKGKTLRKLKDHDYY